MSHQWKQPTPTIFEYNPVDSQSSRNPWKPSPIRRLPWLGLGALLGALAGAASSIAILMASNGKPTFEWSIQPTVYLAIASAVTNILLHLAFSEGVNVAWWRRATKSNTKVADLHRHWSFGNSLWAAVTSGRHFNLVALACLLVALGPINGPLLQRASRVSVGYFSQPSNIGITIAQSLPAGYTGYLSGRGGAIALLTTTFTQTVQAFNRQAAINVSSTGCMGECATTVRGAGFAVNCSASTTPFSLTLINPQDGQSFDTSQQAMSNGTAAFGSYLLWSAMEPGALQLGVQFKDSHACDGNLQIRNCTLQAAVVKYPVIVNGNKSTIELAPRSSIFDDGVEHVTEVALNTMTGPTTLGGLYKALSDTYNSQANLRFVGAYNYELRTTGATSNRYAILDANSERPYADCTVAFTDPSDDILAAIRDMMFRTAIAAAKSSDNQQVTAQETRRLPVYESHYLYLGLASLCTAVGWLAIVPMLFNWWQVGRTVSMSPIETAKAFGAPQLRNWDSNADADQLLKEVGDRPLRYGATTVSGVEYRLEMHEPGYVRAPRAGEQFAG